MIDESLIGAETPEVPIEVEKGMIRQFAAAIAESNPIYFDEAAAQAAGHPSILAPPTFGFTINILHPQPFDFGKLGLRLDHVLHANQQFVYSAPIYAGDIIRVRGRVTEVFQKKRGLLQFISMTTFARNQRDRAVFEMVSVIVCRNEK
jgi:acyl dehydratase